VSTEGEESNVNDLERQLTDYIAAHEQDSIDLLRDLVNCDSGTYNKDEADRASGILANAIGGLGFDVEQVPQEKFGAHVVARKRGTGDRNLLFVGHFDTVFPAGTVAERPFTIDGDRATGPGVYDMKGGLVVLLAALSALKEANAPVWNDVNMTVIFNSDEEILSPTSSPIIEAEAKKADTSCILEPARPGGEYTFQRKGAGLYKMTTHGRAAHSGGQPEKGRSAVEELAQKIIRLHELINFDTGTTVNVGVIRGGMRPNVVAEQAECEFDLRVYTHAEREKAEKRFQEIVDMQFVPDTTTELSGSMMFPPVEFNERNEKLFGLVKESGNKLGLDLKSIVTGGGSDGNVTGQHTLLMDGMGVEGDGAHSDREFIYLPSIVRRASVLALFLNAWPDRIDTI
jgi:glutamate carboxypeptidase